MYKNILVVLLCCVFLPSSYGYIDNYAEYYSMPKIFEYENYDECMLSDPFNRYCVAAFELVPISENVKWPVWNIIQNYTKNRHHYNHKKLERGVCLSENFDANLNETLTSILNNRFPTDSVRVSIVDTYCTPLKGKQDFDTLIIYIGVFISSLALFILFATWYETYIKGKEKKSTATKIILCFSIIKNWNTLRCSDINPEVKPLACIQSIRFFAMTVIILGHTGMIILSGPIDNTWFFENSFSYFGYQIIGNGHTIVQIFFMIGGMLLSYHFLKTMKDRTFHVGYLFVAFIMRYIRLTPSYAVIIAITAAFKTLGSGPYWEKIMVTEADNCRTYWWTNLLYVNNIIHLETPCLQQSWYLACDTQLFIIVMIMMAVVHSFPRYARYIMGTCLAASLIVTGAITYIYRLDAALLILPESLRYYMRFERTYHLRYTKFYGNLSSYIVGAIYGYIYFKIKNIKPIEKNKFFQWVWILSLAFSAVVLYSVFPFYDENYEYERISASIYAAIIKAVYAACLGLFILTVAFHTGWLARWVVKWKPFVMMGRLTYSAYLVHFTIIEIYMGNSRHPTFLTPYNIMIDFMGQAVLSYAFSLVLCLSIEYPVTGLQKLFTAKYLGENKDNQTREKTDIELREDNNANCC